MPGFWESFAGNFQDVLGDYDRTRQEKRQRALQKLKFLTETGDVGTPVAPQDADMIRRHASEGAGMIDAQSQFTGTPDQQRLAQFRKMVAENPDMDPMQMLTQGAGLGAVSGNSLANVVNSNEARASREQIAREQMASREEIARERMQNSLMLRNMMNSARGSGGGEELTDGPGGTKADRQKWLAARKSFNNDPYSYITQSVLNNPETAAAQLKEALGLGEYDEISVDAPEAWESYYSHLLKPNERMSNINDLGLRNQEYDALLRHVQGIANKKRALANANTRE